MTTSNMDADSTQLKDYPKPTFDSDGLPKAIEKTILIAPYNNIEIVKKIVDENEDDLAGIIVEPIQRLIVPKPNFLSDLRKLASKKGLVLIFDEVVTGFRFAYGGAQELYGVIPDIAAYGKAISGGYPMGIVGGKDEIMTLDSEETGFRVKFDGTFYGYPTACIAGLATIRELKKPGTYEKLRRYGAKLRDTLRKIFAENDLTAQVLGEGPMSGYVFTDRSVVDFRSYSTGDKVLHDRLTRELLKNNLIIDMPKMYNATTHGDEELELTSEVFDRSVRSVLKETG